MRWNIVDGNPIVSNLIGCVNPFLGLFILIHFLGDFHEANVSCLICLDVVIFDKEKTFPSLKRRR